MKSDRSRYSGYRFAPEIISYAVWAYHRFCLSFRDVEDLLAERGIIVSYESMRRWCLKFGPGYARKLKRREGRLGDHWHLDEVSIRINGQQHYLWRCHANYLRQRDSYFGAVRQQSSRSLASVDPSTGTANAPIQIC
jgi:transposase-like protein